MHIGLTYDLRQDYLAAGFSDDETAEFDRISTVEALEGALAQLSDPRGKGAALIEELRAGAASFRQTAETLERGEGTIGRLLHDKQYADGLLKKIDRSVGHLDSILGKIDRGEGTLGGIVNDPAVYEGLRDVVAGIQKSRLGKGMIRHYGKKGAEQRQEQDEEEKDKEKDAPPDPGPNP